MWFAIANWMRQWWTMNFFFGVGSAHNRVTCTLTFVVNLSAQELQMPIVQVELKGAITSNVNIWPNTYVNLHIYLQVWIMRVWLKDFAFVGMSKFRLWSEKAFIQKLSVVHWRPEWTSTFPRTWRGWRPCGWDLKEHPSLWEALPGKPYLYSMQSVIHVQLRRCISSCIFHSSTQESSNLQLAYFHASGLVD